MYVHIYTYICIYIGTFDHLHNGHKILLTITCQLSTNSVIIGLTGSELLKNKKYADELIEMSKMHSGSSERYLNTKNIYNKEIFTTANLGFGIVLCCVFIYYNKDYNKILKCVKI